MVDKVYVEGHWVRDASLRGFMYIPSGNYEIGVDIQGEKLITDREIHALIPELERGGFIQPRLDERLRTEDLKITHRLIDLLGKSIEK